MPIETQTLAWPQRTVSDADGKQTTYAVTEDDEVVVGLAYVDRLGPMDAIRADFAAEVAVPPLVVDGVDPDTGVTAADPSDRRITDAE